MGCTQTSPTVLPYNHVPLERIYVNTVHPLVTTSQPIPMTTMPPVSPYTRSVLKQPYPYGRSRAEPRAMMRPMAMRKSRSVNFDEKVLVKPRTPTPDKAWYEKTSTTMPMRKRPPNDSDDDDYEEKAAISLNEEPDYPEHHSFSRPNAAPSVHANVDTFVNSHSHAAHSNRIKVRRRLPDLGAPQAIRIPPYALPPPSIVQLSTSSQQLVVPRFRQLPLQYPTMPAPVPLQPPTRMPLSTLEQRPLPSAFALPSNQPPVVSSVQPLTASTPATPLSQAM